MGTRVTRFVAGSAWALVELLLTLFVLFYLFRDRRKALGTLRSLVPLSEREADEVFTRVSDTIHATVYGTLVVAAVQGGLIFWWLGLPAPILWGTVMGLLAIVPVLGAFIIWVPVALFLAATGQWGKAAILIAGGGIVHRAHRQPALPDPRRETAAPAHGAGILRDCRRLAVFGAAGGHGRTPGAEVSGSKTNPVPSFEQISRLAQNFWEEEGQPEGKADEHWLRAEDELRGVQV